MKKTIFLLVLFGLVLAPSLSFAYWEWTPKTNKWINPKLAVRETPEAQYAWAEEYVVKKDYPVAIRKLEQLIEVFPDSPYAAKARYHIGEIYQMAGEKKKAFQSYQKVIDNYPGSDLVTTAVSEQFVIGGQFANKKQGGWFSFLRSDPADLLTRTVTAAPYAAEAEKALYDLGNYHFREGHFQESIDTFDRLVQDYPESQYGPAAELKAAEAGFKLCRKQKNNEDLLLNSSTRLAAFLARYPDNKDKGKAQRLYGQTRELLAGKVLDVAQFYEKNKNAKAAKVYFEKVVNDYPETEIAKEAKKKIK
ncbi:MAG: tetratricopeptide repeat protein [Candidatus Ratteibacteria bacterium]